LASNIETLVGLVVARLNAVTYSPTFTATAKLYPKFVREDTTGLEVSVLAGPETWTKLSRAGMCEVLLNVPIVIRKPIVNPEAETGELLTLVQAMKDDLIATPVGAFTATGITQSEPFSIDANEAEGLFQTIVTVQYKGFQ
jgi:hypothetical protein